jgi:hypothetical protein
MPHSSKKRKPNQEPEPSSSSSSDGDDDDEDQEEVSKEENIQVDLEARSPIDTDQSAIQYFLEQSFGHAMKKSILDLNQLTTQLVTQQSCGSVFYQPLDSTMGEDDDNDDDEESPVLGICSILRVDQQNNKQLQAWLLDKCAENQQARNILQCKLNAMCARKERKKKKSSMDEWGFEPQTFRMQSEHSTPELHARVDHAIKCLSRSVF